MLNKDKATNVIVPRKGNIYIGRWSTQMVSQRNIELLLMDYAGIITKDKDTVYHDNDEIITVVNHEVKLASKICNLTLRLPHGLVCFNIKL